MAEYYWGEDTYAAWHEIQDLAQEKKAIVRWLNQEDLEQKGLGSWLDSGQSLWGSELVVVNNPLRLLIKEQDQVRRVIATDRDTSRLILWEQGKPDLRLKLHKELVKLKSREYKALEWSKLEDWVRQLVQMNGAEIEKKAIHWLVSAYKGNRWRIENEIQKLAIIHKQISLDLVQQDNETQIEAEIFKVMDAIVARHAQQAVEGITKLLDQGEPELRIMATLNSQFRSLWIISQGKDQGKRPTDISREAKIHPYVVEKNWGRASKLNSQEWWMAMRKIAASNLAIKQGRVQERTALLMLIAGLVEPAI